MLDNVIQDFGNFLYTTMIHSITIFNSGIKWKYDVNYECQQQASGCKRNLIIHPWWGERSKKKHF